MTAHNKQKLKLLYLWRLLEEETDSTHGLSMAQIIQKLEELGISAERKSIYRDLNILREFGCSINTIQRMPVEYVLERTGLNLAELTLLVDAVQSSRFLTRQTAHRLSKKIEDMASIYERTALKRRVHVDGRIKSQSDSVFYNVDTIHAALQAKKKLIFLYYKYDTSLQAVLQHQGKPYELTAVQVVYSEGFYYLIAWSDKHEDFVRFRIDRMRLVQVSENPATRNKRIATYDLDDFAYQAFGMYDGEPIKVLLLVNPDAMDVIADRFGSKVAIRALDDGKAEISVTIRKSYQFFGWIAGMNRSIQLKGPKSLVNEYKRWLVSLSTDD